ncbi:outer membrane beta-barrel protein [uncultured Legionella sp.]|uniref:outer membrane protein n=1 Tax=uncultured Legionella sp. TaxID=210934 RepID=UPI002633A962|nr:outer membrane beta-barrel protein [uncultured Legionella sp.]
MLRKTQLLSTGLVLLTASTVNAGFYSGLGLGSDTVDLNVRSRIYEELPGHPSSFDVINKSHLSATGVFGTLFAGYGTLVHDNYYLAGEANLNISTTQSRSYNHEYYHQSFADTVIKIKNSIGLSILPGYQFTSNTLFYGRLGITNSTFKENTTDISLFNYTTKKTGFRYGLGVKQNITNRLALRMDYSRIDYASINTGTFDPVGKVRKTTQMTASQQLVEFGLVVNFA